MSAKVIHRISYRLPLLPRALAVLPVGIRRPHVTFSGGEPKHDDLLEIW